MPLNYRGLAVCYAHMGQLNEARENISRLRSLNQAAAVMYPFNYLRKSEHREVMVFGLRSLARSVDRSDNGRSGFAVGTIQNAPKPTLD